METLSQKCADINTVSSFCDCIAGEETVDPAAQAFCNRTKIENNITGDDLADLKMALMDAGLGGTYAFNRINLGMLFLRLP
jgi:hypothetical protein